MNVKILTKLDITERSNNVREMDLTIAEHALGDPGGDSFRNTRTTRARWWDRLFLSLNRVNYHLEHHLAMTTPHYNLPRFHRMLRDRGLLDDALLSPS